MLIPRCKLLVVLEIDQISKFPQSQGELMVRWHVMDSPRAESRGRTDDVKISDHQAKFKYHTEFTYYLTVGLDKQLRSGNIEFEVNWHPLGSKNRLQVGTLKLDIAQFVGREPEPLYFLLENARANVLMTLKLNVQQLKGPTNYHIPEFTAPIMNDQLNSVANDYSKKNGSSLGSIGDRKAYLNYVEHFKQSASHANPLDSIADIMQGGDGFCGIPGPDIPQTVSVLTLLAEGKKPNRPVTEDELREDFISWVTP